MSLVKISGNASGTGTLTIAAPNTNSNYTLTLPTNTGTILTSATTTGFPAGSVIQVVSATYSTQTDITSTSYTDTGLTASITPTSASNKILVIVNQNVSHYQNTNATRSFQLQLLRGATQILFKSISSYGGTAANTFFQVGLDGSQIVLDSPSTTSSVTYKTQGKVSSSADSTTLVLQLSSSNSTITLMEIAA